MIQVPRQKGRGKMNKILIPVLAILAVATLTAPVFADSPHFIFANGSVSSSSGALTVSFKDAGLGTGTTAITITVTVSTASATYQCFNNGGNHPKAANKETVTSALAASGSFPVRNGQTTGSLTTGPVSQGSFACPSGQSLFLTAVSYSGITISDATGNSASVTNISLSGLHIFIV